LEHIQAKEYPPDCDEELRDVKSSPYSVSETSNVRAVEVKFVKPGGFGKKKEFVTYICDCPG
jgi:hypothetical protein